MTKRRHGGGTAVAVALVVFAAGVAGVVIAGLPRSTDDLVIGAAPATTAATTSTESTSVPTTEPTVTTEAPDTTDTVDATTSRTEAPRQVRVSVLGDSWSSSPTPAWPDVADELLADAGIDVTFTVDALDLTGYTIGGEARTSFVDRAADVDPAADVVVVFGGFDDRDGDIPAIELAAVATFTTIRQVAPDAELVVVGAPWGNDEPPLGIIAVNQVLGTQARAVDATFVDPMADGWFAGGDTGLIGSDLLHASAAGQALVADRLVAVLEPIVRAVS